MAINTTVNMSDLVKTNFDTAAYFGFRAKNLFRMAGIDVKRDLSADPKRGNAVTFTKTNALSGSTTELPEASDITPSSLGTSTVTLTLKEYGDVVQTSEKLRLTALQDVQNLNTMHEVGASMGEALDIICRTNGFDNGTNITWTIGTTDNTVAAGATGRVTASMVSRQRAFLTTAEVPAIDGLNYVGMIHGHVAFDLMGETGGRGWRDPHTYSDPSAIYVAELGLFDGIRYVENSRCKVNLAATNADVYTTYVYGQEAIAEALGVEPEIRITGPFDSLGRFLNTGWYGLIGHGVFRQESLRLVRSNSSLAARP